MGAGVVTKSLAEILAPPSSDALMTFMIGKLRTSGFPLTDWHVGALQRTILEKERVVELDLLGGMLLAIAAGGWADTATDEWLTQVAHSVYAIDRAPGTQAKQSVTLKNSAPLGTPSVAFGPGDVLLSTDNVRYVSLTGGNIAANGGTITVVAVAESRGAAQGLVNRLESALPGVSVFSASIDVSGGSPAYGSADESNASLTARCLARWPDLQAIATQPRVIRWALASTPNITRVKLSGSAFPNEVVVTVAGPSGAVSGGDVGTAQAYINARRAIPKVYPVQSATTAGIQCGGTVWVRTGATATVQALAQAAWSSYLGTVSIGSRISLAKLIQSVMDAGALEFRGYCMGNAGGGGLVVADYVLSSTEVPVLPAIDPLLANQLLWYEP